MEFSVSSRWNAFRHGSGRGMVDEILALGVDAIELGYDLTLDLAADVREVVAEGKVSVRSVHNYCPVPLGAAHGHPELFLLASTDRRDREAAVRHTVSTIEFAAELGARIVVAHAGRVRTRPLTSDLVALCERGKQYTSRFDRAKMKILIQRERRVGPHIEALVASIGELMPHLKENDVVLALENLPSWEAVPSEAEMERLADQFGAEHIGYWHDTGHAQVRENLGFVNQSRWLERLTPCLCGLHVHSVEPPAYDHLMPPRGVLDLRALAPAARAAGLAVLEPAPGTPTEEVAEALSMVRAAFTQEESPEGDVS